MIKIVPTSAHRIELAFRHVVRNAFNAVLFFRLNFVSLMIDEASAGLA